MSRNFRQVEATTSQPTTSSFRKGLRGTLNSKGVRTQFKFNPRNPFFNFEGICFVGKDALVKAIALNPSEPAAKLEGSSTVMIPAYSKRIALDTSIRFFLYLTGMRPDIWQ